jgi:predicted P-loop ATPase
MTQALRALAVEDDWFIDGLVHLFGSLKESARKETFSQASVELRGPPLDRWIVEVNELKGVSSDDAAALKAFLPNCHDVVRAAYARESVRIARQFVIIGTTDKMEGYLREVPEFWPVRIQRFDLVRLRADRDQLWAEAAEAEAIGESILLEDTETGKL